VLVIAESQHVQQLGGIDWVAGVAEYHSSSLDKIGHRAPRTPGVEVPSGLPTLCAIR
jgi:hypothetical protein